MLIDSPFTAGRSLLHRLDPRAKLLSAAAWSVAIALLTNVRLLMLALIIGGILLVAARLPIGALLRRLAMINLFIAVLWVFLPFSADGVALLRIGPLAATREGIHLATQLTLRCNAIVFALIALLATSPAIELARGLSRLRVPDKLVLIFFLCLRYIQVIHDEYHRIANAVLLRGFRPTTSPHTYRTVANQLGLLLVRSHDRGQRVHAAMACRGFTGRWPRLNGLEFSTADSLIIGGTLAASLALVGAEWLIRTH